MPQMVKMVVASKMPEAQRKRLAYRTRMLTADLVDGAEFVVPAGDARVYRGTGWATDAPAVVAEPEPRRRGRPPKAASAPEPVAEPVAEPAPEPEVDEQPSDPFEGHNVAELRKMAELRGLELEPRYYRRDEMIALLRGASEDVSAA